MLKRRMKTILIFTAALLLTAGLVVVYLHYYTAVNKKYPEAAVITSSIGRKINLDTNTKIIVNSCQYLTVDELRKIVPDYQITAKDENGDYLNDDDLKIYLVNVTITGTFDTNMQHILQSLNMVSGTDCMTINANLFGMLNDHTLDDTYGTETVTLPYIFYSVNYSKSDWNSVGNKKYDLVLYKYPMKYIFKLC